MCVCDVYTYLMSWVLRRYQEKWVPVLTPVVGTGGESWMREQSGQQFGEEMPGSLVFWSLETPLGDQLRLSLPPVLIC